MISAGALLFQVISASFGEPPDQFLLQVAQLLGWLVLLGIFLAHHWRALRSDNRLAEKALVRRYSLYPVLVLSEDGIDNDFSVAVLEALERHVSALPVAVHLYSQGVPDESLSAARAVVLPAELVARPSEALRLWLQGFDGQRVVVPTPAQGWLVGVRQRANADMVSLISPPALFASWRRMNPWPVRGMHHPGWW